MSSRYSMHSDDVRLLQAIDTDTTDYYDGMGGESLFFLLGEDECQCGRSALYSWRGEKGASPSQIRRNDLITTSY